MHFLGSSFWTRESWLSLVLASGPKGAGFRRSWLGHLGPEAGCGDQRPDQEKLVVAAWFGRVGPEAGCSDQPPDHDQFDYVFF